MAIHITWTPTGGDTVDLTVNDSAQACLESYRASLPGTPPDILTMVLQVLGQALFVPAFGQFPPDDVKSAQAAASAAQVEAVQAMQTFIKSALTTGA